MLDGGGGGTANASGGMSPMSAVFSPLSGSGSGAIRRKEERIPQERIPQWGYHETKEFIAIRAELEKDFTQTKRNKTLWELIAGKMKDKGFRRSADQCKCKWKNLVNRYKGKEISEPDNGRQCPFFEELDAIFKERAKNAHRLLIESDGMRPKKRLKKVKGGVLDGSDEDSDDDDEDDEDSDVDERLAKQQHQQQQVQQQQKQKKRKADKDRQRVTAEKCRASSMQDVLEDFFQQQQKIEEQWKEALERKEMERRIREQEWRECMEKLEHERAIRERVWWEREEQRRVRDEIRSQKRDELVEALLRVLQDDRR